ncbi:MAG: right-handed parallel beta-helix repeat-containing protein, partial [Candidatus Thorarchaeota archaeon]|nr:right-handed parallel beta-helix repeat-containing protein [Candidatus Thorarchaeota archaeon]
PITIADYRIESYDGCITIHNVDLYFVIDNCETADIDREYYASTGIKLDNCSNGVISNSLAHMKETGIFIKNSKHITLSGSTVHDCAAGVSVEDCYQVTIHDNNFGWNDFVGVNITGTNQCTVYANTIYSVPYFGIMCIVDTNTYLSNNIITSTNLEDEELDHVGILSYYSVNIAIYNVTISDCATGLEMQNTGGAWIWECRFLRSVEYGVYLHPDTYNVTIVESCFLPSEGITAFDAGEANSWDNPYDEIGNYWGDYNGTGYYYISGPAESIDHFPNRITCDYGDGNYTGSPDNTTTSNTTELGDGVEPLVLLISIGSSVVIILVAVLILRSSKSY